MKRHLYLLSLVLATMATVMPSVSRAQLITDNAVFYHSIRSPWSNSYNPALFPKESGWYVTTAKTSLQLSMPLSYEELGFKYDPVRDVTVLNINDVLAKLKTTGCNFYHNTDVNLLGFGFTKGENLHFTFAAGMRTLNSFNVPLGLIDFITEGNMGENSHIDFGANDIFSSQTYAYLSVGGAFKLPILPLTVGARLNVLDGIEAFSLDNLAIDLTTAEDVSYMRLTTDYLLHTAGIARVSRKEAGTFDFNVGTLKGMMPKNLGFTFDIGAKLKLALFDISLSIVDLGPGISWQQNPMAIVPKQKDISITFEGIDLSTLVTAGTVDTSFIGRLKDSLLSMIDYTTEESGYWYSIPTRMYAGVSASIGKLLRVGYLFQGQWYNGWFNNHPSDLSHFACNNTLSAHLNLFNWMELSLVNSFSYNGHDITWLNPGCALTLSPGQRLQLFAAIEYLSDFNPTRVKAAHVMFGINMVGLNKEPDPSKQPQQQPEQQKSNLQPTLE